MTKLFLFEPTTAQFYQKQNWRFDINGNANHCNIIQHHYSNNSNNVQENLDYCRISTSFGWGRRAQLRERLWDNHHVSLRVKFKVYKAIVLSTLLYGAGTWTVYRTQVKNLNAYMMRHLREIMKIAWKDRVSNDEIYRRSGLAPTTDILIERNLRRIGNVHRMNAERLPRQLLYS